MKFLYRSIVATYVILAALTSHAQSVIATPEDVITRIDNSFDLQRARENTHQAEIALNRATAPLYYPEVSSSVQYKDSQQLPLSPFLPAQTKDVFWEAYLTSHLPYGVTLQAGQQALRSRLGQASPPNPLLPFPSTNFQPEFFIRASLNLTRDLFGGETRRQIKFAKDDVRASEIQEELLKHKLKVSSLGLFYQLPTLASIRDDSAEVIAEYQRLERSIAGKVNRSLAEKSDLYNIKNAIAEQEALVRDTDRAGVEIKSALALLLGDASLQIAPAVVPSNVTTAIRTCEDNFLKVSFDPELTHESDFHKVVTDKADFQAKNYKWATLPDLTLNTGLSATGTDNKLGPAIRKQWSFKYPIFEIGVFLNWQTSPGVKKTAQEGSSMRQRIAHLQADQRTQEQKGLFEQTRQDIELLRQKQDKLTDATAFAEKELADLRRQYANGRMTLFQLIQQRAGLLQTGIQSKGVTQERLNNLAGALQYFDRVECELFAQAGGKP